MLVSQLGPPSPASEAPGEQPARRFLLSIHDVSPRSEAAVDRLRDHLGRHAAPDRIALLVVPNHWGEAPITRGSGFAERLRGWSAGGAEIFVHGWFHKDATQHRSSMARLKSRHMTAGEGEFLGLDRAQARSLMGDGKKLLEDITGRSVAGFIAPAWLYGAGSLEAMSDCKFKIAEDHWKIWEPITGQVLAKSPVLTWASRSRSRMVSSLLAARVLPPLLRTVPVARVAVHPGDTTEPAILASIDRAISRLVRTHRPGRYAELLSADQVPCAA